MIISLLVKFLLGLSLQLPRLQVPPSNTEFIMLVTPLRNRLLELPNLLDAPVVSNYNADITNRCGRERATICATRTTGRFTSFYTLV
jgi:hypothetical protein